MGPTPARSPYVTRQRPCLRGTILRSLPRAFDDLPIWAQLNITYKCNLDCSYCSEYDNSKDHVPYADLVSRIDKIKSLGALHTDLIGGEPLLHPELIPLMKYVTGHGMTTGMTTNGFLLTEEKLGELIDAGMGRIQMIGLTRSSPSRACRSRSRRCARRSRWSRAIRSGSASTP